MSDLLTSTFLGGPAKVYSAPHPSQIAVMSAETSITRFMALLSPEQEVGAMFMHFAGQPVHITRISALGSQLVEIEGVDEKGRNTVVIQHVSQFSVALVAVPVEPGGERRKIGFSQAAQDTQAP